jgi:NAD-dependent deacetylase
MTDTDAIRSAREILAAARKIVVFSGSGLSAESGIPTFRDVGGIWERFRPEDFATIQGLIRMFVTQPDRIREFVYLGIGDAIRAEPNAAHRAIAELEQRRPVTVATQNIDGLHQAAGSRNVFELHGTLYALQCDQCGWRTDLSKDTLSSMIGQLAEPLPRVGRRLRLARLLRPLLSRCSVCRGRMRPAIVFFGEGLPPDAWKGAEQACLQCRAMLVVGTSAQVYPAAMLPSMAHNVGAKIVVVTLDPSFTAPWTDCVVVGPAAEVVPTILGAVV